ncbi:D-alanine--poly(phosphoribitol) ligase subunit DltC [Metabacillus sp. RGM 3146]|uniref:D-alanine--poly(phosphoribitol) ligase subunit DltC n=1 Tax=Metabacillus sp. RGM 3146 TaxID=3401092 RepID=UPI003B9C6C58
MNIKEEVLNILEEICETDAVKEDMNIPLFDEGLLDSLGTVTLLVDIEEKLGIMVSISEFDREKWSTPNKIVSVLENLE